MHKIIALSFPSNLSIANMPNANLTITKEKKMIWDKPKHLFGSREERHSLVRFVIKQSCHLPVTVRVRRRRTKKPGGLLSFVPALINDTEKVVILTHKRYKLAMDFDDIVKWIRIFITSNKMYEQDLFKHYG